MQHIKKLVFLSLACYLASCDVPASNQQNDSTTISAAPSTADIDEASEMAKKAIDSIAHAANSTTTKTHKHYTSVVEMVEELGDFATENGTLKVISKSPLHIQIVAPTDKDGDIAQMKKVSMQDIVYVAYEAFATTDATQLTITSVPCDFEEFRNQKIVLLSAASTTVTITKERARQVMESRVGTTNFDDMVGATVSGSYFPESPSPKLDELKSEKTIEQVIRELKS